MDPQEVSAFKGSLKKQQSFKDETKYVVLKYLYQTPSHTHHVQERGGIAGGGIKGQTDLMTDGLSGFDEIDFTVVQRCVETGPLDRGAMPQRRQTGDRTKLSLDLAPCVSPIGLNFTREDVEELTRELEEEVSPEIERLRNEADLNSPVFTCTTPETEVASILGRIGDEVTERYGKRIDAAASQMLASAFSYSSFKSTANKLLDNVPGWNQVALLLSFSQQVGFRCVKKGERHLSDIGEYTTNLIVERAADFIISEGGWGAVSNVHHESPVFEIPPPLQDKLSTDSNGNVLLSAQPPATSQLSVDFPFYDTKSTVSLETLLRKVNKHKTPSPCGHLNCDCMEKDDDEIYYRASLNWDNICYQDRREAAHSSVTFDDDDMKEMAEAWAEARQISLPAEGLTSGESDYFSTMSGDVFSPDTDTEIIDDTAAILEETEQVSAVESSSFNSSSRSSSGAEMLEVLGVHYKEVEDSPDTAERRIATSDLIPPRTRLKYAKKFKVSKAAAFINKQSASESGSTTSSDSPSSSKTPEFPVSDELLSQIKHVEVLLLTDKDSSSTDDGIEIIEHKGCSVKQAVEKNHPSVYDVRDNNSDSSLSLTSSSNESCDIDAVGALPIRIDCSGKTLRFKIAGTLTHSLDCSFQGMEQNWEFASGGEDYNVVTHPESCNPLSRHHQGSFLTPSIVVHPSRDVVCTPVTLHESEPSRWPDKDKWQDALDDNNIRPLTGAVIHPSLASLKRTHVIRDSSLSFTTMPCQLDSNGGSSLGDMSSIGTHTSSSLLSSARFDGKKQSLHDGKKESSDGSDKKIISKKAVVCESSKSLTGVDLMANSKTSLGCSSSVCVKDSEERTGEAQVELGSKQEDPSDKKVSDRSTQVSLTTTVVNIGEDVATQVSPAMIVVLTQTDQEIETLTPLELLDASRATASLTGVTSVPLTVDTSMVAVLTTTANMTQTGENATVKATSTKSLNAIQNGVDVGTQSSPPMSTDRLQTTKSSDGLLISTKTASLTGMTSIPLTVDTSMEAVLSTSSKPTQTETGENAAVKATSTKSLNAIQNGVDIGTQSSLLMSVDQLQTSKSSDGQQISTGGAHGEEQISVHEHPSVLPTVCDGAKIMAVVRESQWQAASQMMSCRGVKPDNTESSIVGGKYCPLVTHDCAKQVLPDNQQMEDRFIQRALRRSPIKGQNKHPNAVENNQKDGSSSSTYSGLHSGLKERNGIGIDMGQAKSKKSDEICRRKDSDSNDVENQLEGSFVQGVSAVHGPGSMDQMSSSISHCPPVQNSILESSMIDTEVIQAFNTDESVTNLKSSFQMNINFNSPIGEDSKEESLIDQKHSSKQGISASSYNGENCKEESSVDKNSTGEQGTTSASSAEPSKNEKSLMSEKSTSQQDNNSPSHIGQSSKKDSLTNQKSTSQHDHYSTWPTGLDKKEDGLYDQKSTSYQGVNSIYPTGHDSKEDLFMGQKSVSKQEISLTSSGHNLKEEGLSGQEPNSQQDVCLRYSSCQDSEDNNLNSPHRHDTKEESLMNQQLNSQRDINSTPPTGQGMNVESMTERVSSSQQGINSASPTGQGMKVKHMTDQKSCSRQEINSAPPTGGDMKVESMTDQMSSSRRNINSASPTGQDMKVQTPSSQEAIGVTCTGIDSKRESFDQLLGSREHINYTSIGLDSKDKGSASSQPLQNAVLDMSLPNLIAKHDSYKDECVRIQNPTPPQETSSAAWNSFWGSMFANVSSSVVDGGRDVTTSYPEEFGSQVNIRNDSTPRVDGLAGHRDNSLTVGTPSSLMGMNRSATPNVRQSLLVNIPSSLLKISPVNKEKTTSVETEKSETVRSMSATVATRKFARGNDLSGSVEVMKSCEKQTQSSQQNVSLDSVTAVKDIDSEEIISPDVSEDQCPLPSLRRGFFKFKHNLSTVMLPPLHEEDSGAPATSGGQYVQQSTRVGKADDVECIPDDAEGDSYGSLDVNVPGSSIGMHANSLLSDMFGVAKEYCESVYSQDPSCISGLSESASIRQDRSQRDNSSGTSWRKSALSKRSQDSVGKKSVTWVPGLIDESTQCSHLSGVTETVTGVSGKAAIARVDTMSDTGVQAYLRSIIPGTSELSGKLAKTDGHTVTDSSVKAYISSIIPVREEQSGKAAIPDVAALHAYIGSILPARGGNSGKEAITNVDTVPNSCGKEDISNIIRGTSEHIGMVAKTDGAAVTDSSLRAYISSILPKEDKHSEKLTVTCANSLADSSVQSYIDSILLGKGKQTPSDFKMQQSESLAGNVPSSLLRFDTESNKEDVFVGFSEAFNWGNSSNESRSVKMHEDKHTKDPGERVTQVTNSSKNNTQGQGQANKENFSSDAKSAMVSASSVPALPASMQPIETAVHESIQTESLIAAVSSSLYQRLDRSLKSEAKTSAGKPLPSLSSGSSSGNRSSSHSSGIAEERNPNSSINKLFSTGKDSSRLSHRRSSVEQPVDNNKSRDGSTEMLHANSSWKSFATDSTASIHPKESISEMNPDQVMHRRFSVLAASSSNESIGMLVSSVDLESGHKNRHRDNVPGQHRDSMEEHVISVEEYDLPRPVSEKISEKDETPSDRNKQLSETVRVCSKHSQNDHEKNKQGQRRGEVRRPFFMGCSDILVSRESPSASHFGCSHIDLGHATSTDEETVLATTNGSSTEQEGMVTSAHDVDEHTSHRSQGTISDTELYKVKSNSSIVQTRTSVNATDVATQVYNVHCFSLCTHQAGKVVNVATKSTSTSDKVLRQNNQVQKVETYSKEGVLKRTDGNQVPVESSVSEIAEEILEQEQAERKVSTSTYIDKLHQVSHRVQSETCALGNISVGIQCSEKNGGNEQNDGTALPQYLMRSNNLDSVLLSYATTFVSSLLDKGLCSTFQSDELISQLDETCRDPTLHYVHDQNYLAVEKRVSEITAYDILACVLGPRVDCDLSVSLSSLHPSRQTQKFAPMGSCNKLRDFSRSYTGNSSHPPDGGSFFRSDSISWPIDINGKYTKLIETFRSHLKHVEKMWNMSLRTGHAELEKILLSSIVSRPGNMHTNDVLRNTIANDLVRPVIYGQMMLSPKDLCDLVQKATGCVVGGSDIQDVLSLLTVPLSRASLSLVSQIEHSMTNFSNNEVECSILYVLLAECTYHMLSISLEEAAEQVVQSIEFSLDLIYTYVKAKGSWDEIGEDVACMFAEATVRRLLEHQLAPDDPSDEMFINTFNDIRPDVLRKANMFCKSHVGDSSDEHIAYCGEHFQKLFFGAKDSLNSLMMGDVKRLLHNVISSGGFNLSLFLMDCVLSDAMKPISLVRHHISEPAEEIEEVKRRLLACVNQVMFHPCLPGFIDEALEAVLPNCRPFTANQFSYSTMECQQFIPILSRVLIDCYVDKTLFNILVVSLTEAINKTQLSGYCGVFHPDVEEPCGVETLWQEVLRETWMAIMDHPRLDTLFSLSLASDLKQLLFSLQGSVKKKESVLRCSPSKRNTVKSALQRILSMPFYTTLFSIVKRAVRSNIVEAIVTSDRGKPQPICEILSPQALENAVLDVATNNCVRKMMALEGSDELQDLDYTIQQFGQILYECYQKSLLSKHVYDEVQSDISQYDGSVCVANCLRDSLAAAIASATLENLQNYSIPSSFENICGKPSEAMRTDLETTFEKAVLQAMGHPPNQLILYRVLRSAVENNMLLPIFLRKRRIRLTEDNNMKVLVDIDSSSVCSDLFSGKEARRILKNITHDAVNSEDGQALLRDLMGTMSVTCGGTTASKTARDSMVFYHKNDEATQTRYPHQTLAIGLKEWIRLYVDHVLLKSAIAAGEPRKSSTLSTSIPIFSSTSTMPFPDSRGSLSSTSTSQSSSRIISVMNVETQTSRKLMYQSSAHKHKESKVKTKNKATTVTTECFKFRDQSPRAKSASPSVCDSDQESQKSTKSSASHARSSVTIIEPISQDETVVEAKNKKRVSIDDEAPSQHEPIEQTGRHHADQEILLEHDEEVAPVIPRPRGPSTERDLESPTDLLPLTLTPPREEDFQAISPDGVHTQRDSTVKPTTIPSVVYHLGYRLSDFVAAATGDEDTILWPWCVAGIAVSLAGLYCITRNGSYPRVLSLEGGNIQNVVCVPSVRVESLVFPE